MRLSLFWKLMAAFALVLAVGVGGVTLLAGQTTTNEFQHYMFAGGSVPDALVAQFAGYYAQHGSWQGVQTLVADSPMPGGPGMMGPPGSGRLGPGGRLILADARGDIVGDSAGEPGGV